MRHPKFAAVLAAAVTVLLALGAAGCEEPGSPREYRDPDKVIYAEVNKKFSIVLESNRTTGYSWQLQKGEGDEAFDTEVLELVSTAYEEPDSGLLGAPGEERWTFKALSEGRTRLSFAYVRPWETGAAAKAGTPVAGEEALPAAAGAANAPTAAAGAGEEEAVSPETETVVFTVDVGPSGAAGKSPEEYSLKDGQLKKGDEAVEEVEVELGAQFALVLESNPTTGYAWQLAEPPDEALLFLVSGEYRQSKEKKKQEGEGERMVGVGGEEVWTFRAVGLGEAEISLEYIRSWERDEPAADAVSARVKVVEPKKKGKKD